MLNFKQSYENAGNSSDCNSNFSGGLFTFPF